MARGRLLGVCAWLLGVLALLQTLYLRALRPPRPPPRRPPPARGVLDASGAFRVYWDVLGAPPGWARDPRRGPELVLATHGTPGRAALALGGSWRGPVSVAVFGEPREGLRELLAALGGPCRALRGRLRLLVVQGAAGPPPEPPRGAPRAGAGGCRGALARAAAADPPSYSLGVPYPGNLLRNAAWEGAAGGGPRGRPPGRAGARFVLLLDADVEPSPGLREGFLQLLRAGGLHPKNWGGLHPKNWGGQEGLHPKNWGGHEGPHPKNWGELHPKNWGGQEGPHPKNWGAEGDPRAAGISEALGDLGDPKALSFAGVLGDPKALGAPGEVRVASTWGNVRGGRSDPSDLSDHSDLSDPNALRDPNPPYAPNALSDPHALSDRNALSDRSALNDPNVLSAPHSLDAPHAPSAPNPPDAPLPSEPPWARLLFVLPAFELRAGLRSPASKAELLRLWGAGDARPFYGELCPRCQAPTAFGRWRALPPGPGLRVAYEVPWRDPWEPFYVAPAHGVPRFDERFLQYGFNRISQACELHVAGFRFAVLDRAFVTHSGFKEPGGFHRGRDAELGLNRRLFRRFREELKLRYPGSPRRC